MRARNTRFILSLLLPLWSLVQARALDYPVPGCSEPAGFSWTAVTHESVSVRWDSAVASTLRFELAVVKKGASTKAAFKNPVRVYTGNTYTFTGLEISTAYDLFIRRVCQTPVPGDEDFSEWVRISAKTAAFVPMDCNFDTTLVAIGQVTHDRFTLTLSPPRHLSPTGRRLLLRYRLTAVPPGYNQTAVLGQWQERLICDENKMYVDHLCQGGTYEVYVKQLRDGSYMEYTKACEEVGPLGVAVASREVECDHAQSVTQACVGADFITLHFEGPALGYDSLRYLVAVKPVDGMDADWKFYYHFSGSEFTVDDLNEQTRYQISAYLLVGKSGFGYDYICSEMIVDDVITLPRSSIIDVDGDGIPDGCDPDDNDGPMGDSDNDGIANQDDDDTPQNPFPQMPELKCGQTAAIPQPDPAHLLDQASQGEIFFIHGFPILLDEVSGGQGTFSGKGVIGLPFAQAKYLEVEFHNIQVDSHRTVISGVVNGISQDLGNFPNIPLDTITFGDERFCRDMPEEEGFDENGNWTTTNSEYNPLGFNQEGSYQMPPYQGWEDGNPYDPNYDPNGFDAEGNHIDTGTPYNPNGCNQVGLDSLGQPCNPSGSGPYYWLAQGTTQQGIALANEVEDSIRPMIMARLADLTLEYTDSISATKIRCDLTRDSMREYFYDLGYTDDRDRIFIFGPGDNWFKEGMSQEFTEKPEKLGITIDRDSNEEYLENTHINLYNCDLSLIQLEAALQIINHLKIEPGISETVDYLKAQIQKFSPDQALYYSDLDHLRSWIKGKVDSIITGEQEKNKSTSFLNAKRIQSIYNDKSLVPQTGTNGLSQSLCWVGNTNRDRFEPLLIEQVSEITWQDIVFEYHQGRQKVAGLDRAYYLESICKSRVLARGTAGPSGLSGNLLPLEISKDILGKTYTLYMDNVSFTPEGGTVDIYIIVNTNPSPDRLVFKTVDVPFDPTGFLGNVRLLLGTDISITLSNAVKMNLLGNNNTFISIDCDGFSSMSLDGEVEFCRNYIVPLTPGTLTPKPETESVKAHFLADMPAWGEFVVELDIDPFALANHDSIKWQANNIVFDFSSMSTPGYIKFPANYSSPFVHNNNGIITASGLWKGFYFDQVSVTLPKQFGNNIGTEITIGAENIIFDDTGLTGKVFASPLLSICEGNLSGWAFSIDTFAIQVTNNRLDGFTFNGLLNLPIFSHENSGCSQPSECIKYEAAVLPGNMYSFSVKPIGVYEANLWKATVTIEPNSEIEIRYQYGMFKASAILNGSVSIDGDLGQNFMVDIPGVTFQNLILRNQAPYFEPGLWSVPNATVGVGFGGFGITIDSIRMAKVPNTNDRANLKLRVGLIIVDSDFGLLMVDGGVQLKGKLMVQNNRQRWVYDGFLVDDIMIDASFPGVDRVHGKLAFFGQQQPSPSLGRGFSGKVMVDFQGIDVEIAALGVFGNKGPYKYFMIDALAKFKPGIGSGVLQLVGFGGGASYHMGVIGDLDTGLPSDIINVDPATVAVGTSLSGLVYAPDENKGINIHATVVLSLAKEEAFNVNATFGMSFYSNGGLDEVYFKGTAKFMDELDFSAAPKFLTDSNSTPDVPTEICAFVHMSYAFAVRKFHGNFKVKIDAAGVLKGEGEAELLIQPGYWFINVGTPQQPIHVKFFIPKLKMTVAEVAFYFDIGKNIPPFPGLPGNVKSLTGLGNIVANEALRRTGNGFATGLRFTASTDEITFLIFYARFDLGLGFDLMVQDYGNATCVNNGGEPLGINGWYASGQLWAYVHGEVGIKVRLWGKTRHFDILNLSVAAALQAKFPNPFYARGAVGGKYRILGGLVKGSCRFEFAMGEECQIQGGSDPWADQEIILDMNPVDSLENVHTLAIPKVNFTVPLNENLNDGNNIWRAELVHAYTVKDGLILNDEKVLKEGKTALEVKPVNALSANIWFVFKVKVRVLKNGQIFKTEEKEVTFKTGDAPDIIPVDNIQHAYPFDGQYNFYKNEHPNGKGFIELKFGQPELFQNPPPGFTRVMELTRFGSDTEVTRFPFIYNESLRRVEFSMPSNLQAGGVYKLEMINDANDALPVPLGNNNDEEDSESNPEPAVPPVLYRACFRVSQYNKVADKIEELEENLQISTYSTGWIRATSTLSEPFDHFELFGNSNEEELLSTSLNINNLSWFNQNKSYLKLAYNYQQEPIDNSEACYLSQFTNTYNAFDQQNFSSSVIGFEQPLGNPILMVSQDGEVPTTGIISQFLDFTSLNAFSVMWGDMKMDLLSYKTLKCAGSSWYGTSASNCSNFTYCCANAGQQGCCTSICAFEGNPHLIEIADHDMPVPQSSSKFQVSVKYNIPGYGLSTSKIIEIVKP